MLIYYSAYAAIPLLFIINSLRPTLPWSCEGLKSWFNETSGRLTVGNSGKQTLLKYDQFSFFVKICNGTNNGVYLKIQNYTDKMELNVPSVLYFL